MKSSGLKEMLKLVGTVLITAVVVTVVYIFMHGWPIFSGLQNRQDVVSVEITQNGETVTVTDEEDILLACRTVNILKVKPAKTEAKTPDTTYVFKYRDGSEDTVGASDDAVFKNGKAYSATEDSCVLFDRVTEGIFFLESAVLRDSMSKD